eukprot:1356194-Pyramimonas_sp.AAC.1
MLGERVEHARRNVAEVEVFRLVKQQEQLVREPLVHASEGLLHPEIRTGDQAVCQGTHSHRLLGNGDQ